MDLVQKAAPLTQPADGTVVGLIAQRVGAGVTETKVPAGQDERVSQVRQTDNTLIAVVTVLIVRWLMRKETKGNQAKAMFFSVVTDGHKMSPPIPWSLGCFCSQCHRFPGGGSSHGQPGKPTQKKSHR